MNQDYWDRASLPSNEDLDSGPFGRRRKPSFAPPQDDDDPFAEMEADYRRDMASATNVTDKERLRVGLINLIERRREARESKKPKFQFEDRPTPGVPTQGRYQVEYDPVTNEKRGETYQGSQFDPARAAQDEIAQRQKAIQERQNQPQFIGEDVRQNPTTGTWGRVLRFRDPTTGIVSEQRQGQTEAPLAEKRFQFEQGRAAESDKRFATEREDRITAEKRREQGELTAAREHYGRQEQVANVAAEQRRQAEANRQEQAGFSQQAQLQQDTARQNYVQTLRQAIKDGKLKSIIPDATQRALLAQQLARANRDGSWNDVIAALMQDDAPMRAAPRVRFAGQV